ncbi:MAG: hypothetical protein HC786_33505 [Richelia sp. CSU_2_1]|nr:hypothetical protein [Microcoleus sp. SM1_3_4]NJR26661.1 hypothetical protein [Richelia sp. CSU_2_1]
MDTFSITMPIGRKKEEGRRKKEEGRRKKEVTCCLEGRGSREEVRRF